MRVFFLLWFLCGALYAEFTFVKEPIDVVIPCVEKDLPALELCIDGIRRYGKDVRRIIVVSSRKLTDNAEWFDEALYPFSKDDIAKEMGTRSRVGWVYQQFLKLYAPFVIPEISSNVLMLDSDTIFLHPVEFLTEEGAALFNSGDEYHKPYFIHAQKLLPGLYKVFQYQSGICHHMVFQRDVLEHLFADVEAIHGVDMWRACVRCIDTSNCDMSEFEIYFNYVFARSQKVQIRHLKWANIEDIEWLEKFRRRKFTYVSWHDYKRKR